MFFDILLLEQPFAQIRGFCIVMSESELGELIVANGEL